MVKGKEHMGSFLLFLFSVIVKDVNNLLSCLLLIVDKWCEK